VAAVVLTVLFAPVALVKHGSNAEFNDAAPVVAHVDQDTELPAVEVTP
jgi:hypothetical protein